MHHRRRQSPGPLSRSIRSFLDWAHWAGACLAVILLVTGACGGGGTDERAGRVVVLGLDGVDPGFVAQLVEQGKLPHFAELARGGASGPLRSQHPLLSPVIWTTIATGRPAVDHGITHFVIENPETGRELPVTSRMRQTPALWNLLTDAGKTTAVVGWWATWPAEDIDGAVISDRTGFHFLLNDPLAEEDLPAVVSPPELQPQVEQRMRRPEEVTAAEVAELADVPEAEASGPFSFGDDLSHLKWALATADSYRNIGLYLQESLDPDLLMVYFEAPDTVSHLFGHLVGRQDLEGELAEQQQRYGRVVEAMYQRADAVVGEFMNRLGPDDVLFVVSDHGFELGELPEDPSKTRDLRRVSHEFHRLDGIFYAYGAGVRPGAQTQEQAQGVSILDLTPTVLALLGLPPSEEMPGRVLTEIFEDLPEPQRIAAYDPSTGSSTGAGDAGAMDEALVEKLRSLGYIGGGAPKADRNLATLQLRAGEYRKAAQIYHRLLQEDPDNPGLNTDFATAMAGLERYDEAAEALERALAAVPDYAPAYYRRGAVAEARGERAAAVADYRRALRYDPDLQGPRRALERLGEPAVERVARTPEEIRSAELLQQAQESARRGGYDEAWELLLEAENLTPEASVVYQYKGNVAFLRGDREAAVSALKKALELDPDDARIQENLRRLQEGG